MKKILIGIFWVTMALGELNLVPGRLSIDGLFVGYGVIYQGRSKGWSNNGFEFRWRLGTLSLTGDIRENTTAKIEFDFSHLSLRDLYIHFNLGKGFALRTGQFAIPMSFEAETPERYLKVEEYSILYGIMSKPNTIRDIGILLDWQAQVVGSALRLLTGVMNGTGPNSTDNNTNKDVFTRVVFTPVNTANLSLGGRAYCGWVNPEAVRWLGFAGEAVYQEKSFTIAAEVAYRRYQNISTSAGLLEAAYEFGVIAPAMRFEGMRSTDGQQQFRVLSALTVKPVGDNLKVMIGYQYNTLRKIWSYQGLIVQLVTGF
ncbi:MAG: porin [candidate division WOR-3 bacterium]